MTPLPGFTPDVVPLLGPGWTVIDIGANVGQVALQAAQAIGPTGRLICVEPNPQAFTTLLSRVGAHPAACAFWPVALADTEGHRTFHMNGHTAHSSLYDANLDGAGQRTAIEVRTVTLDVIAAGLPGPLAIKIDAQGAEAAILAGGRETLTRLPCLVQVEVWPAGLRAAGSSAEALATELTAAGYHPIGGTWADLLHRVRDWGHHRHTNVVCEKRA